MQNVKHPAYLVLIKVQTKGKKGEGGKGTNVLQVEKQLYFHKRFTCNHSIFKWKVQVQL